jgi:hypothetical protein
MSRPFDALSLKTQQRNVTLLMVIMIVLLSPYCLVSSAFAAEKRLEVEPQLSHDAALITKVTLGDSELKCGLPLDEFTFQPVVPFDAGDDWIRKGSPST